MVKQAPKPYKHQKLYQDLLRRIQSGEYSSGDRLPGQREMMADYGVSLATVSSALEALVSEGVIFREHGRGTFVREPDSVRQSDHNMPKAVLGLFLRELPQNRTGALKGMVEEAQALGVHLQFILFEGEAERRARAAAVLSGEIAVDGCLLMHVPGYDDVIEMFHESGFPHVVVDVPCRIEGLNQVLMDQAAGACAATEHLISHGHRRIALLHLSRVHEGETDEWAEARVRGYEEALLRAGLDAEPGLMMELPGTGRAGVEEALGALLSRESFTALFCSNGGVGVEAIDLLRKKGMQVPLDVAVIAFDVDASDRMAEVGLSGIRVPAIECGAAAIRCLTRSLGKGTGPWVESVPMPLTRRTSCGCA